MFSFDRCRESLFICLTWSSLFCFAHHIVSHIFLSPTPLSLVELAHIPSLWLSDFSPPAEGFLIISFKFQTTQNLFFISLISFLLVAQLVLYLRRKHGLQAPRTRPLRRGSFCGLCRSHSSLFLPNPPSEATRPPGLIILLRSFAYRSSLHRQRIRAIHIWLPSLVWKKGAYVLKNDLSTEWGYEEEMNWNFFEKMCWNVPFHGMS